MKKIYRWKFLREGFRSQNGVLKWEIGKWNRVGGRLSMCENGLHCSRNVFDAFYYVRGEILARVECRGDRIIEADKECWREMKVVKAYEWTKKDTVEIAIYAARLVLPIFEKSCPNDNRPRKAIDAAVNWLNVSNEENKKVAMWAAINAIGAVDEALRGLLVENEIVLNKKRRVAHAARSAAASAMAVGSDDLIIAMFHLWEGLILVKSLDMRLIEKLKARFDKQVIKLKEIKNEEGWLTKILKKVKMIINRFFKK